MSKLTQGANRRFQLLTTDLLLKLIFTGVGLLAY